MGRFRHRSGTLRHDAAEALTDTGISAEVAPGQRGPLAIADFQEAKTVVHAVPRLQG
jgi:hypothetical protein